MNPANYRPINLTSHISKVFERVVKSYLIKHLESQNLIKTNQHGFVSGRSTMCREWVSIKNINFSFSNKIVVH